MWTIVLIIAIAAIVFIASSYRKGGGRQIAKIQALLNKDRTICDVINALDGWEITNIKSDVLVIIIDPLFMPVYKLYITYRGRRPNTEEIKLLHWALTNEDSVVTRAHNADMPVECFMEQRLYEEAAASAAQEIEGIPGMPYTGTEVSLNIGGERCRGLCAECEYP